MLALPPSTARQTKPRVSGEYVVRWPWFPRPPKNHFAKNTLRDPFDSLGDCRPQTTGYTLAGSAPDSPIPLLPALCYTIVPPGRESGFRSGLRPGSSRESLYTGSPGGRRPILRFSRLQSGRNMARKLDFRPGSTIASHRVGLKRPWPDLRGSFLEGILY